MALASATSIQAQSLSPLRSSPVDKATRTAPTLHKSDANQLLQLDDGGAENAVGFNSDTNNDGTTDQSLGALYFNRFTPPAGDFPLDLQNAQIQFGTLDDNGNVASGGLSAGDVIDIYVWSDPDGDPATGATLKAALTGQSLGTVDATFQTFDFPSAVRVDGPGDILIGFVNRTLPSTATFPATIDETASQGRSWVAAYADNAGSIAPPENPPVLPADGAEDVFAVVGDLNADLAGNWMIRGSYDVVTGSGNQPLSFALQVGPTNPFDGITNASSAPGFGDLDGDGDLDMVLVDNSIEETFAYYENTGTAADPAYAKRTGGDNPFFGYEVNTPEAPSFADLDNDGDLDMAGGAFDQNQYAYFENVGSSSNPVFVDRRGDLNPLSNIGSFVSIARTRGAQFVDIDNDNDYDILTNGQVIVENKGSASVPQFRETNVISNISEPLEYATLFDADRDGDKDLIARSFSGPYVYYENIGGPSSYSFTRRTGRQNPLYGYLGNKSNIAFGDIDGDGDQDLIVRRTPPTTSGTQSLLSELVTFENGQEPYSAVVPTPIGAFEDIVFNLDDNNTSFEINPTFGDLDGDGDLDLVMGTDNSFAYYENTGSQLAPEYTRLTGTANPLEGFAGTKPELVDLDADGDLDLATGSGFESNGSISYYENLGTPTSPVFASRSGSSNPFQGLISFSARDVTLLDFVDYDNDGDPDLVVGAGESFLVGIPAVAYFENVGSAVSPSFESRTGTSSPFESVDANALYGVAKPIVIDLDGDGDLDLILAYDEFVYFENTGTQESPAYVRRLGEDNPFVLVGQGNSSAGLGKLGANSVDLDDDGDEDFVALHVRVGETGGLLVTYGNGSVEPPLPVELARFTASASGESVDLRWSTTSEENNAGFDVERSTDGETFTTIGFEPGVGTTEEAQSYRFVDREAPFATTLFYRLRQVDTDGTFEYSPVVEVQVTPSAVALLPVAPNPVSASARLRYELPEATAVRLQVFDLLGRRVATLADGEKPAGRHEVSWRSSGLASGTYFVRLQAGSTAQTQMLRLVR
jgi:hypothetical protein